MTAAHARSQAVDVPVLDMDPYSRAVLADPYPFQEALREAGPAALLGPHGVYAVGRHAECAEVLSDHGRFTAKGGVGIQDIRRPGDFRVPNQMLENDPPGHTAIRRVLTRYLSPVVIRGWRDAFTRTAREVVAEALARPDLDGVEHLAERFVLRAFPEAIGVRLPRREILAIGEMRFNQSGPRNEFYDAAMARAAPYLAWFEGSVTREGVTPGSLAASLFDAEDRGEFEPGVTSNMVRSFVGGGTDSTISGIGHALNALAHDPGQWALVRADPGRLARNAFEEALRLEAPFQVTYRTTVARTELSGLRLDADVKVGVFLGAANRDPRKWVDPGRYDVTRDLTGVHLGFGSGPHVCIGQMVARLEAEAMLAALAAAAEFLEPAGAPEYRLINQMRSLARLPLRAGRARADAGATGP